MPRPTLALCVLLLSACGSPATRGPGTAVERPDGRAESPAAVESGAAQEISRSPVTSPAAPDTARPSAAVTQGTATEASPTSAAKLPAATVEAIARAEVKRLTAEQKADRVAIVVLDPEDGRILAAVGAGPEGDRQTLRAIPTGSTLKTLTVAAALDAGLNPNRRFTGEGGEWRVGGATIRDVTANDWLDAPRVLIRSSNIGAAKIAEAHLPAVRTLFERLRWSAPPARGAEPGSPSLDAWKEGEGYGFASGMNTRASPLFLAAAYVPFANLTGELVAPTADGTGKRTQVVQPYTAELVSKMLHDAVEEGTGKSAAVPGLTVGGKTGTAPDAEGGRWGHFVGFADLPGRWVIAVAVYSKEGGYVGGTVAAPSFARLVKDLVAAGAPK